MKSLLVIICVQTVTTQQRRGILIELSDENDEKLRTACSVGGCTATLRILFRTVFLICKTE